MWRMKITRYSHSARTTPPLPHHRRKDIPPEWQPMVERTLIGWGGGLTLDTERSISLREVILTTDCGENDFRIELSNDNEKFSDCMSTTEKTKDGYRVKLSIPATCRYIRVTFSKPEVKLYEIEARGILK